MFVCVYLCACDNDIFPLVLITNQEERVLITEKLIGYIVQMQDFQTPTKSSLCILY